MLQARGDAVIPFVADLQEPPEMIAEFLQHWEAGYKIVMGVKVRSGESPLMFAVRKFYYRLVKRLSEVELTNNFYGFGLYDRSGHRNPAEDRRSLSLFPRADRRTRLPAGQDRIPPAAPRAGHHEKQLLHPLRHGHAGHHQPLEGAACGWPPSPASAMAALSLLVASVYFAYKLIFWNHFEVGIAPLVIGIFFFSAVQLFFTGILGEYIGAIHTQVLHRPLVIEKERINFDE